MRRVHPALLFPLLLCASLRLGGEVRVRGANFTYDGAGNRIKELLNTATVPTSTTAANITAAQFASLYANEIDYGYDDLNRLANVTLNGNYIETGVESSLMESLTYRYDYQNRRALRLDDQTAWPTAEAQQVWQEVYDGQGPVRDEYASYAGGWSLGLQADYVRGSDWGGGIGGVLYAQTLSGNANTAKYYNYDGRGDVVALTSNTGNVTYAAAYNAYGQHATVTASNVTTTGTQEVGTDTDLFRLTTKEEDPFGGVYDTNRELGLNDNNWFQRDPAGMVNGPNPYTYVEQNNWTKTDPLGLQDPAPSPGATLQLLPLIAVGLIGSAIVWQDITHGFHPSSTPSSDQSPAQATPAPQQSPPAAAQPPVAPPPPNDEGNNGDKSSNKNKSGGDDPEGSSQKDKQGAQDKVQGNSNEPGANGRPNVDSSLPDRVTGELPEGDTRTPEENKQARNFFKNNKDAAKEWWKSRTGEKWPGDSNFAEHPRALKDGGDPLYVEPGFGDPNAPHNVPGPDGVTDSQRWGAMGGRPPGS